jgi:prepilin-type N-terminal cleavage/methylation domain-containing protein
VGCLNRLELPAKENKTSENKERYMKKGFTLIELMIVIAIIAIIAAIAIPNLLSGRMSANETSALGALKLFTSSEAIWFQQGPDGNGVKDYWTYDVSCLHRLYRADGVSKVAFIPMDVARADARPAAPTGTPFGTNPLYEQWTANAAGLIIWPKSGYWFTVMDYSDLNTGTDYEYNHNAVGPGLIKACNSNKYGFMAAPDIYGTSGIRSFIVNEAGVVYAVDSGLIDTQGTGFSGNPNNTAPGTAPSGTASKWETSSGTPLEWPSQNPIAVNVGTPPKPWESSD